MEVEREDEARCLRCGFVISSKSSHTLPKAITIDGIIPTHNPNEHPNGTVPRPALSPPALYRLKFRVSQAKSQLRRHGSRRIVHVAVVGARLDQILRNPRDG